MYLVAPDYLSFYEGHYHMFWLPLLPKRLAKWYLFLRNRDQNYIDTITYITRRRIVSYLRSANVEVYDHRMLSFHQRYLNDIENPDRISSPLKKLIYKAAKTLKITKALVLSEQLIFRVKNRWINLVVIKNPGKITNTLIKTIRTC